MKNSKNPNTERKELKALRIVLYTLGFMIVLGAIGQGLIQNQAFIHNKSGVKTTSPLIIYSGDTTKSAELTTIDWGLLYPDSYKIYYFSVYNDHPQNEMELYFTTDNWSPKEAQDYIKVEWNLQNFNLKSKNIVKATIQLTVSEEVKDITNFSFDITVTGVESVLT